MASRKRKRGRPVALTSEQIDRMAAAVELGASASAAVLSEGYSRNARGYWERVGEQSLARREADPTAPLTAEQELYAEYVTKMRKAMGAFECSAAARLRELGDSDPKVLQWLLERKAGEDWMDPAARELADLRASLKEITSRLSEAETRAGVRGPNPG